MYRTGAKDDLVTFDFSITNASYVSKQLRQKNTNKMWERGIISTCKLE